MTKEAEIGLIPKENDIRKLRARESRKSGAGHVCSNFQTQSYLMFGHDFFGIRSGEIPLHVIRTTTRMRAGLLIGWKHVCARNLPRSGSVSMFSEGPFTWTSKRRPCLSQLNYF